MLLQTTAPSKTRRLRPIGASGKGPTVSSVIDVEMVNTHVEQSGWFDWLQQEESFAREAAEDLVVTSVRVLQLNGRVLYLALTTDLAELNAGGRPTLQAVTRHGATVF